VGCSNHLDYMHTVVLSCRNRATRTTSSQECSNYTALFHRCTYPGLHSGRLEKMYNHSIMVQDGVPVAEVILGSDMYIF